MHMADQKLKLLFIGKTNFTYNRDLILLNGLKARKDVIVDTLQIKKRNGSTYIEIKKRSKEVDFVVVPSFRHKDVAYVKSASKAPVVFDPLISKYMTRVLDYQVKWKGPHKYIVDWLSFYWPDFLIWDTQAHQNYLRKKYRLSKKMAPIYIGVDTSLFYPIDRQPNNKTIVGFYGSFNPLQGIDKIIRAAHLLREDTSIEFKIIGSGSTYSQVRKIAQELKVNNVEFVDNVPYEKLNEAINEFDICLGVFGDSYKTDVVIPNKIYQYAAAKKCIITKNTEGVKEIFENDKNICLVDNNAESISNAIRSMAKNLEKRDRISEAGYKLISKNFNKDKVAESFVKFLRTCN